MVVGEIATGTEVLVIGAGPGGYVAAIRAAQLSKEVTLVEKDELGGICLNHGCIPSKALIYAANFVHKLKHLDEMGITVSGVKVDVEKLQSWKQNSVVNKLTSGIAQLCKGHGIEVIKGRAVFTSPKKVSIESEHGTQAIEFKKAIIATGSRSVELPGFEFDGEMILSSRHALKLKKAPQRLLIIGGGYIGLELGTFYAKLGSQVTVIEMMSQLLPGNDLELVRVVERKLKQMGIEIYLNSKAKAINKGKDGAKVIVDAQGKEMKLEADKVLVSVGRRPNHQGLGLEKAGVELDGKGFIKIDGNLRTTNPNIHAIGDVAGPPLLAHKATHEGIVAAEIMAGLPSAPDWRAVPAVIFTDPEIATVGLTEKEAQQNGYKPIIGRFPFAASGRALTTGETDGFVKIIADESTQQILGVHIVGPEASNLISEAALAIEMGATLEDIALTIHPHPTLPESLMEAAGAAMGKAIHILSPRKK